MEQELNLFPLTAICSFTFEIKIILCCESNKKLQPFCWVISPTLVFLLRMICHQQRVSYFPFWVIFLNVLPVDARTPASISLTFSENGCCVKNHRNPTTRRRHFSEILQNRFSIIQKEEEEREGLGGGREGALKPGVIFVWLRIPLGPKNRTVWKKPCKIQS